MKEYMTGDELIDKKHGEILDLCEVDVSSLSLIEAKNVLKEIFKHTLIHFIDEESYMLSRGISEEHFQDHKLVHDDLRQNIQNRKDDFMKMSKEELRKIIIEYRNLIIEHILNTDTQMVKELSSK